MDLFTTNFEALLLPYFSSLLAFIPALINAGIIYYIQFKLPRNKTTDVFTYVVLALIIWQLEDTILRLPISMEMARLWDGILCIGWLGIAPLLLHFSVRFAQLKKLYRRSSLVMLYAPFIFFYVLYMSNIHGAVYVRDNTWGWINQLRGGTLEEVRWLWTYLITIASIFILVHHAIFTPANKQKKTQAWLIAMGIVLPALLVMSTQLLFPVIFSSREIPVTSFCMSVFSVTTIIAVSKYKLFRISDSLKSYNLLENLNRLVLIVSPDKKIIYANRHASDVLGIAQDDTEPISFENIFPPLEDDFKKYSEEVFDRVVQGQPIDNFPGTFITSKNERINVMMSSSLVVNNHIKQGVLLVANDITQMVTALKDLEFEKLRREKEIAEASIIAQEDERKFIGGELHDNVNQILASSLLYLSIGKRQGDIPFVSDVEGLINSAIQEIRKLSHSLIAPSLEEAELTQAVDNIVEMTRKTGRFDIKKEAVGIDENILSEKIKLNVYRIIQEQLNNIIKYSQANTVRLKLVQESNKLFLNITDDGVGFDTTSKSLGRGMANMKSRARLNNGTMDIISSPGNGCELSVVFENIA